MPDYDRGMFFITYKTPGLFLKNIEIKLYKKNLFLVLLNKKLTIPFKKFIIIENTFFSIFFNFKFSNFLFFNSYKKDWALGKYFGFCHRIYLSGLGFKFLKYENYLIVKLGIVPNFKIKIPKELKVYIKKKQELELFSCNKILLYKFFNFLIKLKRIDAYTLKGIYSYKNKLKKKVSSKLTK